MKKGDVVTIHDGSYTKSVVGGKLIHERLNYGSECDKQYVVIEVNCKFPAEKSQSDPTYTPAAFNNTVIQQCESDKVVFIEACFLRLKYRPVPVREVTMADVCARFGEEVKIKK